MGNYIDIDGLTERMTSTTVTDLCNGLTGTAQTTFLNNVITRAESLVNSFAAVLYTTPLPVAGNVQEWSYAIAEYEMYKRGLGADVPPKYKLSYDETIKLLESVSKGLLIPSSTAVRNTTNGNSVSWASDAPIMASANWTYTDEDNESTW